MLAVSTVLHKPFSSVKIANDVILVLLALLLSYFVFHGIRGLRKGQLFQRYASAFCEILAFRPDETLQESAGGHRVTMSQTSVSG